MANKEKRLKQAPPTFESSTRDMVEDEPEVIVENKLIRYDNDDVLAGPFQVTKVGLVFTETIDRDQWEALLTLANQIKSAYQWIIADWAAFGETQWGVSYDEMSELTGYKKEALYNMAWVAKQVQFSLRSENLSFSHHAVVASQKPRMQQVWLERAVENGWSAKTLAAEIEGERPPLPSDLDKFSRLLARNRQKYDRFGKKFRKMGQGAKTQITQMLDEEIAYLQSLKENLEED